MCPDDRTLWRGTLRPAGGCRVSYSNAAQKFRAVCGGFCNSSYHCFANANFPKKTNNPNPSPIGNKFGLFLFGPSGENRTHGLLNPIQARYQNCATPGHHPLPPYRSTGDMRYYTRIRQSCQQIFAIFLDFFEESMILTVMRCFASY